MADIDVAVTQRIKRLGMFFEAHFENMEWHQYDEEAVEEGEQSEGNESSLIVSLDGDEARVSLVSMVRLQPIKCSVLIDLHL